METKDQIYISHYISQYHTAISPRDFLTRADQDYNMFPGLNRGGNLSPEAWTWGSRCSAWTKWRGHLNSLSRKGSLRFTHWSLVSILFGKKKKSEMMISLFKFSQGQEETADSCFGVRSVIPKPGCTAESPGELQKNTDAWALLQTSWFKISRAGVQKSVFYEILIRWFWINLPVLIGYSALGNP